MKSSTFICAVLMLIPLFSIQTVSAQPDFDELFSGGDCSIGFNDGENVTIELDEDGDACTDTCPTGAATSGGTTGNVEAKKELAGQIEEKIQTTPSPSEPKENTPEIKANSADLDTPKDTSVGASDLKKP